MASTFIKSSRMLQRGRARLSAEGGLYGENMRRAIMLQRGRAHLSAEGWSGPVVLTYDQVLQRGRAHLSAEGVQSARPFTGSSGFNGAALT